MHHGWHRRGGLLRLLLLAAGGTAGWRALQGQQRRQAVTEGPPNPEALRILEERYARGEIVWQEFEERRRTLEEAHRREQGQG